MSHVRKLEFCLCENKAADQLCSNCTADQQLCFCSTDRTISPFLIIQNFKLLAISCDSTDRFVSDLGRDPEDQLSCVVAPMVEC